jgi:DNA-directed RNA polymerase specialized sigma24 family protein
MHVSALADTGALPGVSPPPSAPIALARPRHACQDLPQEQGRRVDHARGRLAEKRGGGWERVTLVEDQIAADPGGVDVLALHESLVRLAAFDPRQERIVELRYFGGLTIEEAAEVIGISAATVVREWTIAKAWLRADLSRRP